MEDSPNLNLSIFFSYSYVKFCYRMLQEQIFKCLRISLPKTKRDKNPPSAEETPGAGNQKASRAGHPKGRQSNFIMVSSTRFAQALISSLVIFPSRRASIARSGSPAPIFRSFPARISRYWYAPFHQSVVTIP